MSGSYTRHTRSELSWDPFPRTAPQSKQLGRPAHNTVLSRVLLGVLGGWNCTVRSHTPGRGSHDPQPNKDRLSWGHCSPDPWDPEPSSLWLSPAHLTPWYRTRSKTPSVYTTGLPAPPAAAHYSGWKPCEVTCTGLASSSFPLPQKLSLKKQTCHMTLPIKGGLPKGTDSFGDWTRLSLF